MIKREYLQKILEEYFEWFHRHPETALEEFETTEHIKKVLEQNNIEIINSSLKTGLVAIIRGKREKPVIALRCDIDALEIQEETELSYQSENPGKMHACGHDFHTTAILGAALLLNERKQELEGTVKILFQPAEEANHGAEKVLETGVLDDVDLIFGLHVIPDMEPGTVVFTEGGNYAAVDKFVVDIEGIGSHAAHPHKSIDPIVVSAQLINAFQTIISRGLDPFDNAVISVTSIHAGTTWNVISASAQMVGTVRTFNKDTRDGIHMRMAEICKGIGSAFGAKVNFNWYPGAPATNNDPGLIRLTKDIAGEEGMNTIIGHPTMGGEDFACYQERIKGAFIEIGIGESYPLHHSKFKVDKSVLYSTAKLFAEIGEKSIKTLL